MRELKFRAWDNIENEWVPDHDSGNYVDISIRRDGAWRGDNHVYLYPYKEERITFEQYTGLDDEKGTEIYEGDIVRTERLNNEVDILEVVYGGPYDDAGFGITSKRKPHHGTGSDPTWDRLNPRYAVLLEVVGNIHENPELLK